MKLPDLFLIYLPFTTYSEIRDLWEYRTTQKIVEPAQNKTYNKPCETSEDSDQPARPRSDQIACAFYSIRARGITETLALFGRCAG